MYELKSWRDCPNCGRRLMVLFSECGFKCITCGYKYVIRKGK